VRRKRRAGWGKRRKIPKGQVEVGGEGTDRFDG